MRGPSLVELAGDDNSVVFWPQPYPVMVANPVRGLLDRKRAEGHLQSSNESKTKQNENDKKKGTII